MKTNKNPKQTTRLRSESQTRLLAYTTAASIGAFFAATQSGEAQATLSTALAPYPHTLIPGNGTGAYNTYFYLDIDGDGTADFNLSVNTWRVDISGTSGSNLILNPSSNAYIIPWSSGTTVDSSGSVPTYKRWLATPNFNNFSTSAAMGFEFSSGLDGQEHFGYIDIQVNGTASGINSGDFTATVSDIYWNATPNAGIPVQAVPEPSSLALLAAGIVGLATRRRRH